MAIRCFECGEPDSRGGWWGKATSPWYWFCTPCSFTELPNGDKLSKVDLNLEPHIGFRRWIPGAAIPSIKLWCGHGVTTGNPRACEKCVQLFTGIEVLDVGTKEPFQPRTLPYCRPCHGSETLETACPTCSATLCRFCVTYDGACIHCTRLGPRRACPKCRAFLPLAGEKLRTIEGKLIQRGEVFRNYPQEVVCDRCGDKREWISTPTDAGLPGIRIIDERG